MESEARTILKFYATNKHIGYEENTEGLEPGEMLKIVGMMHLAINDIVSRIDKAYIDRDPEEP